MLKLNRFTLCGFRRPREALGLALGSLEQQVMDLLWKQSGLSVRSVHAAFGERVAYTTLMTTLDRLHRKGLLERRKTGRAFVYSVTVSPDELAGGVAQDLVDGLLDDRFGAEPVLSCIVDAVGERDRALLDKLERIVRAKKRQLRGEE